MTKVTKKDTKKSEPQKQYITVFKSTITDNKTYNSNTLPPPDPNKQTSLDANTETIETDEDIVRRLSYKLNNPIKDLINESETSRFKMYNRRKGIERVPRRQNAWILYRRDKSSEFGGSRSATTSKKIAGMWSRESNETVMLFEALTRMSEKKHIERYGKDYKYKPKKPSQKKSKKVINCNESGLSTPANLPSSSNLREQQFLSTPEDLSVTSYSNFEWPPPGLIMIPSFVTSGSITSPSTNNVYLPYYSN